MKASDIHTLDHAPQVAAEWLSELCQELDWTDRHRAYRLLRETLHALRDSLPVGQVADLAFHMPILIRGLYYENWEPAALPAHPRDQGTLLDRVAARVDRAPDADTERAIAAVVVLLRRRLSVDEAAGVSGRPPERRRH